MDFKMPILSPEAHKDVIPTYKLMYMYSLHSLLTECDNVESIVKALKKRLVPRHGKSVANDIVQAAIKYHMAGIYLNNYEALYDNPDDFAAAQKLLVIYDVHQEPIPAYVQQVMSEMIGRFHSTITLGKKATSDQILESVGTSLEDSTSVLTSQYYSLRKELETPEERAARRSKAGKHGPQLREVVAEELGIPLGTLDYRLNKLGN